MQFNLEAFYNPYLSAGATRVDAVLTVTASGDDGGIATPTGGGGVTVGIIVDTSGSMQGARIEAVRHATRRVLALLRPDMHFFIIRFSSNAAFVYPPAPATPEHLARADTEARKLAASGDTWMSTGLELANSAFQQIRQGKSGNIGQALFLTDGKNNERDESRLEQTLALCEGVFQCECRGVGTDWQVRQLQKIATRLLGSAQIIADPSLMEADFTATITHASQRTLGDVRLRLWTPRSAKIVTVKQMSPEIVLLTDRGTPADAQATDYPTGAWGKAESRDYYVAIEMQQAGDEGEEMLAARPSVVYAANGATEEVKNPQARIVASWTVDEALSARISPQVAHYTGQAELAQAIQEGLEARATGDMDTATRLLGRAAKLAQESGNTDTTTRLRKVVDIVDAHEGTVRLRQNVQKADEMDLDLGSSRTARARRPANNNGTPAQP